MEVAAAAAASFTATTMAPPPPPPPQTQLLVGSPPPPPPLSSLEEQMQKIIQNNILDHFVTAEYKQAVRAAPALVQWETPCLAFLRREQYHALRASRRLCLYWKYRKQVFGELHWLLPLRRIPILTAAVAAAAATQDYEKEEEEEEEDYAYTETRKKHDKNSLPQLRKTSTTTTCLTPNALQILHHSISQQVVLPVVPLCYPRPVHIVVGVASLIVDDDNDEDHHHHNNNNNNNSNNKTKTNSSQSQQQQQQQQPSTVITPDEANQFVFYFNTLYHGEEEEEDKSAGDTADHRHLTRGAKPKQDNAITLFVPPLVHPTASSSSSSTAETAAAASLQDNNTTTTTTSNHGLDTMIRDAMPCQRIADSPFYALPVRDEPGMQAIVRQVMGMLNNGGGGRRNNSSTQQTPNALYTPPPQSNVHTLQLCGRDGGGIDRSITAAGTQLPLETALLQEPQSRNNDSKNNNALLGRPVMLSPPSRPPLPPYAAAIPVHQAGGVSHPYYCSNSSHGIAAPRQHLAAETAATHPSLFMAPPRQQQQQQPQQQAVVLANTPNTNHQQPQSVPAAPVLSAEQLETLPLEQQEQIKQMQTRHPDLYNMYYQYYAKLQLQIQAQQQQSPNNATTATAAAGESSTASRGVVEASLDAPTTHADTAKRSDGGSSTSSATNGALKKRKVDLATDEITGAAAKKDDSPISVGEEDDDDDDDASTESTTPNDINGSEPPNKRAQGKIEEKLKHLQELENELKIKNANLNLEQEKLASFLRSAHVLIMVHSAYS